MSQTELLEELRKLPPSERLKVVAATLQDIEKDLQEKEQLTSVAALGNRLAIAAEALRQDYLTDPELTVFTALDGEEVHAQR